jgi:hypothetical protein
MCSQRMWRLVRKWTSEAAPSEPAVEGRLLGPWAATVSNEDERSPVIAIDVGTYLTIVFPLGDASGFHDAFAGALDVALRDIGVPRDQIAVEVEAVKGLPLARLLDATLRDALDTVEFVCGTELEYHTDLRIVQRNLNRFPHNLPPEYVPALNVLRVFGVTALNVTRNVH